MIGRRFAGLTVVSKIKTSTQTSKYNCLCDCGKIKRVAEKCLVSGAALSCGCTALPGNSKCSVPDCNGYHSISKSGEFKFCKGLCRVHYQAEYDKNNPKCVERRKYTTKRYITNNSELYKQCQESLEYRYSNLKATAKRRKISVEIDFFKYAELVDGKVCVYCEGPLPKKGTALDRVNSKLGYSAGNIVPCCANCNMIRGHDIISYEEMLYIMPLLLKYREDKKV